MRCDKIVISKKLSEGLNLSSDKTATDDMIIKSRLPCDFCFQGHAVMRAILFSHPRDSLDFRFLPLVLLVASFLMLSGCSHVPDAVNPVEWYEDIADWASERNERMNTDDEEEKIGKPEPVSDLSNVKATVDRINAYNRNFQQVYHRFAILQGVDGDAKEKEN